MFWKVSAIYNFRTYINKFLLLSEYRLDKHTHRCYKFVPDVKSWNDSVWNCLEDKAYPSTVYTVEKALAIKRLYAKTNSLENTHGNVHFIGFRYFEDAKAWLTVFGKEFTVSESY